MKRHLSAVLFALFLGVLGVALVGAEPLLLRVDFSKPDGSWTMPALALGVE